MLDADPPFRPVGRRDGYLALEDLGLIGDGTSAALVGLDGSLDLLSEQIDPSSGDFSGNFPQAFSHIGVIARLALLVVAAGFLAVSVGLPRASGVDASRSSCPMSHVHYAPFPGEPAGLKPLPWMSTAPGGKFRAYLFFYPTTSWGKRHLLGARIFTIRKPRDVNPKVLWSTPARGYNLALHMAGRRLDAPGSFSSDFKGFGDYPSYVEVPAPGCWRVTVTTGRVSGSVVFSATD